MLKNHEHFLSKNKSIRHEKIFHDTMILCNTF